MNPTTAYPIELTLGLTISEICNLECSFCTRNISFENFTENSFYKKRMCNFFGKFMNSETFRKILNNIDINISRFLILGLGEPLLNPDFLNIIKQCSEINSSIKEFIIYTNGIELNSKLSFEIINVLKKSNKNFTFVFSVGAFKEETYFTLKKRNFLNIVTENVSNFISNIKKNNINNIFTTVQCVVCETNSNEILDFYKFWKNIFEKNNINFILENDTEFEIRNVHKYTNSISIIPCIGNNPKKDIKIYEKSLKDSKLNEIILNKDNFGHGICYEKNKRQACPDIFRYPFIFIDGTMSICCYDIEFSKVYGNLSQNKLSEIFLSKKALNWRKTHIDGELDDLLVCKSCVGSDHIFLQKNEISDYCEFYNIKNGYVKYFTRLETGKQYKYKNIIVYSKDLEELLSGENIYTNIKLNNTIYNQLRKLQDFKEYRIENNDNTLLPCAHWFKTLIIKHNKKYFGCDLSYFTEDSININKILQGDYSTLPNKCKNCIIRERPDFNFFRNFQNKLNKNWKDLIYTNEELNEKLPDFNTINLETFLSSEVANYRIGWKRIILKYNKDKEKLDLIAECKDFPQDSYFYAELCKAYFIMGEIEKGLKFLKKAYNLNKVEYFISILENKNLQISEEWESVFLLNHFLNQYK
ncbi:MAG: radical SAM protein [Candidatus Muirbacterium halophilum]|nr:radical SAM protein [Candidatus Muirbacterium halophilum]MCK9474486.1 radical SAM protein [Candidatus Muirbacterium halophilum]